MKSSAEVARTNARLERISAQANTLLATLSAARIAQAASRRRPQPPRRAVAATPGTRQHGLGLSVDLCGGVQDFSAPAHLWMQRHAPLYGWFHPAWAESSGVRPEPWHWEFAS